jgi:hypothetical protein
MRRSSSPARKSQSLRRVRFGGVAVAQGRVARGEDAQVRHLATREPARPDAAEPHAPQRLPTVDAALPSFAHD